MHDSLGQRMKRYESATSAVLTPRTPVILRIDGKAFHTYTRGLGAFDVNLGSAMVDATRALCSEVNGCQFGYTQSDEISLLVHTYKRFGSEAWFDNKVQKMVSVVASIAAATVTARSRNVFGTIVPAVFDARAFVLPECEVPNYFIWRQQDCVRNSVHMLARSVFSHKQCHHKNQDELKTMLVEAGHSWDQLRGSWRMGWLVSKVGTKWTPLVPERWTYDSALFADALRTEEESDPGVGA